MGVLFAHISMMETLMFGSLISAVDPVATLCSFSHLQVDRNLYTIIFGESLVNDAMAIVLYRTFKHAVEENITDPSDLWGHAFSGFFKTSIGSTAIGVVVGTSATLYFRFVKYNNNTDMEALVLIFTAYTSFLLAEVFHLSGILAALVCGIWCAVVTDRNLSDLGDDKSHTLAKQFAGMAEMVLFVLSGMMTVLFIYGGREPTGGGREHFNIEDFSWPFFLCTLGLILVARALALFPLAAFLNWYDTAEDDIWVCFNIPDRRTRYLSARDMIMMWAAGLRGAIAIGLAMDLPTPHRYTMLTTTCMIVLFTTLVFGSSTPLLLKLLNIPTGVEEPTDDERLDDGGVSAKSALLHALVRQNKLSGNEVHHAHETPHDAQQSIQKACKSGGSGPKKLIL